MSAATFPVFAIAVAAVYGLIWLRAEISAARTAFKTAPVAILAAASAFTDGPFLLAAGLALAAIGDAALSRPGETAFKTGLGAFLLAHIAYIPLFWQGTEGATTSGPAFWLCAGLMVAYAIVAARWLWPHLGEMRPPVTLYMMAIATMGVASLTASPLILAGAILFIISDTVLAAETFVLVNTPRKWTSPTIWVTYIAAQTLIFWGVMAL